MELTLSEIAHAVHAKNDWGAWATTSIEGIEFDSRLVSPHILFVPLKGERDGHDFIQQAIGNGCSATFWDVQHQDNPPDIPYLLVEDCLLAMQELAHYYRKKETVKVIAVTGSNGKTTTKDMLASVFLQVYPTYKTQGNYNNHIGLPYTILHMPKGTEFLVLEMGMDHPGEIKRLSDIAEPDIAIITMIGESHIEYFGSRDKIANAKLEIVSGLRKNGTLFVSGTEPLLDDKLANLKPMISIQAFNTKNYQSHITHRTKDSTDFYLVDNPNYVFSLPIMGDYNVLNALVTICVSRYFDLSDQTIQNGFNNLSLTKNRTQWETAWNGAQILNDTYNANPTAMHLILTDFFKALPEKQHSIVLGDMLELGQASKELHEQLSESIPNSTSHIFLYGEQMRFLYNKLLPRFQADHLHYYFPEEIDSLKKDAHTLIEPGDLLLIKGSNGMHLKNVVQALKI